MQPTGNKLIRLNDTIPFQFVNLFSGDFSTGYSKFRTQSVTLTPLRSPKKTGLGTEKARA